MATRDTTPAIAISGQSVGSMTAGDVPDHQLVAGRARRHSTLRDKDARHADKNPAIDATEFKAQRSQGIPLGRLARTREVANAVVFLASDLSSFITGPALAVDGGYNQI